MNFQNEIAPQNVEPKSVNVSLANQCLNSFDFEVNFINDFRDFLYKKTHATSIMIELRLLKTLCVIPRYAGLGINEFWTHTYAKTALGKSQSSGWIDKLCYRAINDELKQKLNEMSNKDKESKQAIYKLHHDFDSSTKEGIYPALAKIKIADVDIDEMSDILKNKENTALFRSLVKSHGIGFVNTPSQKKNYNFNENIINNTAIYVSTACPSAFVQSSLFKECLENGSLNRGVSVIGTERIRKYILQPTKAEKEYFMNIFDEYFRFCKLFKDMEIEENFIENHKIYKDFCDYRFDEMEAYPEPFDALFARSDHQFIAVAQAFFYASEFERYRQNPQSYTCQTRIDSHILTKANEFMHRYTDRYIDIMSASRLIKSDIDKDRDSIIKTLKNILPKNNNRVYFSKLQQNIRLQYSASELQSLLDRYVIMDPNNSKIIIGLK